MYSTNPILIRNHFSDAHTYNSYKIWLLQEYKNVHYVSTDTNHAAEVAHMALDLLTGTENFVIPHMPGEKLKIRSVIAAYEQWELISSVFSVKCSSKFLLFFTIKRYKQLV